MPDLRIGVEVELSASKNKLVLPLSSAKKKFVVSPSLLKLLACALCVCGLVEIRSHLFSQQCTTPFANIPSGISAVNQTKFAIASDGQKMA